MPSSPADSVSSVSPPGPTPAGGPRQFALRGARVYVAPDRPPVDRATVLVRDGRIEAVGDSVEIPQGTPVLAAEGRTITAGYWNAHVHFTENKWRHSHRIPAPVLEGYLRDMLASRGFTTVVDTGSDPRITMPLRRRVESGEVAGPRIFTSGPGLYPPRGLPYYLRASVPFWLRPFIPQPASPRSAERAVHRGLAHGADLVKLFTGSYVARGVVKTMPEAIARAAVDAAHAQNRLVFSHPSNLEGSRIALEAGVDVLAHPPDSTAGVDRAFLRELVDKGVSMIPTLQMFAVTVRADPVEYLEPIYAVVREFRELGGQLLFGTDVGYMQEYSTDGEFRALERTGASPNEILRMLTTAPADRFNLSREVGSVEVGKSADLVVLEGDPFHDVAAFSQVRATMRAGRLIYSSPN